MSAVANRRHLLESVQLLVKARSPVPSDITRVLTNLGAVLTDLSGEDTHVVPMTTPEFIEHMEKDEK